MAQYLKVCAYCIVAITARACGQIICSLVIVQITFAIWLKRVALARRKAMHTGRAVIQNGCCAGKLTAHIFTATAYCAATIIRFVVTLRKRREDRVTVTRSSLKHR